jgi:hypothetical protein
MDITIENFQEKLDLVKASIKSCDFISIDTEFSGNNIKNKY